MADPGPCGDWRCPDCRDEALDTYPHPLAKPGVHSGGGCLHGVAWSARCDGCRTEVLRRQRRLWAVLDPAFVVLERVTDIVWLLPDRIRARRVRRNFRP